MYKRQQFWQSPDTLKQLYVSTAGGGVGGTQSSNAVAGTVVAPGQTTSANSVAGDAARNAATNALANTAKGAVSTGSAVSTSAETMVPFSAFSAYGPGSTPLAVNHQGLSVASTLSFNLAPGKSLSDATNAIATTIRELGVPADIRGTFQGTAAAYQSSLANEPVLILAALAAVYIVLGVLYELSLIHI